MIDEKGVLTYKKIFIFWVPLAATWLMMATEGPFLAAIIARLADPKFNLAAYGVAYSFGVLIEAPIIMIMSASTALVRDRDSYLKLRNFTFTLNGICTLLMIFFVIPPVFYFIVQRMIGLPPNVAQITHHACIALLVWPGSIGYRRFYQGLLIRSNLTRRVAYGTIVRLSTMASSALVCYFFLHLNGALVGTLSLSLSVTAEAVAVRLMSQHTVKRFLSKDSYIQESKRLSYRYITKFYYPLALTSILSLGVHPLVTFFMGQSRMPIESLAALPVINSLVFIFRSMGLSFQEFCPDSWYFGHRRPQLDNSHSPILYMVQQSLGPHSRFDKFCPFSRSNTQHAARIDGSHFLSEGYPRQKRKNNGHHYRDLDRSSHDLCSPLHIHCFIQSYRGHRGSSGHHDRSPFRQWILVFPM